MVALRFSTHLVALAALMVSVGCTEPTATVSGLVTLDGDPLHIAHRQRGTIIFHPVDGGPVATGVIGADGTYQVSTGQRQELVPGTYRVTVRVVEVLPATDETLEPTGRPSTPAIYADAATSGLEYRVSPGENRIDLKLRSDAGPAIPPGSALRDAPPNNEERSSANQDESQDSSSAEVVGEAGRLDTQEN